MSLTFKMWLPVIIVSVITIISMIIAKIVTDEDTWVFGGIRSFLCRRSLICNCPYNNILRK